MLPMPSVTTSQEVSIDMQASLKYANEHYSSIEVKKY